MSKTTCGRPAKRILILCGSPRPKGNTNTVAEWVRRGAVERGARVDVVDVARLKYKVNGCIACRGCQKIRKYECVVRDDARPILASMPDYDVLVFATPVYFFGPTAQLKLLLDRMLSLFKFGPSGTGTGCAIRHVRLGLVSTAGDGMGGGLGALARSFRIMSRFTGCPLKTLLVPQAPMDPRRLAKNAALKKRAVAFGRLLARR